MRQNVKLQAWKRSYRKKWKYVLLVIPSIFLLALFSIYPNIAVFPLSLYKWSPLSSAREFVGFHNFRIMFTVKLEETLEQAGNTLIYIAGLFFIQTILSLVLSLALQKNTKKNNFFRAYFFLPMVFSSTMIAMTWNFMYDPNLGIINNILGFFGVKGFPGVNLMDESWKTVLLVVAVHIWANLGYPLMILASGLSTISDDLSEAAALDGANRWQMFTKITFPLLLPTICRMTLLTISTGAMATDYMYMVGVSNGQTWASAMYTRTMGGLDYGEISAAGVLLFIVLAVTSAVQFVTMRKVEDKILG